MRHTHHQTTTRTLTDLYRALDHQHAITITYLAPGDAHPTIRTIEIEEIHTTKNGGITLIAMCRLRGEERQFLLASVQTYTVHRMAYVLTRPAPTKYERPVPAPTNDADALFYYELARDQDDADHTPRVLIQDDTSLAA